MWKSFTNWESYFPKALSVVSNSCASSFTGHISLRNRRLLTPAWDCFTCLEAAVKLEAQDEHRPAVDLCKQRVQNSGASQSLGTGPKRLLFKEEFSPVAVEKCPSECSFGCMFQLLSSIKSCYIHQCNWYARLGDCIGVLQFLRFSCFCGGDWWLFYAHFWLLCDGVIS